MAARTGLIVAIALGLTHAFAHAKPAKDVDDLQGTWKLVAFEANGEPAEFPPNLARWVIKGDKVFYEYRGKGGKTGRRELPRPAYETIVTALARVGQKTSRRWVLASRSGRRLALGAASPAAPSTATCGAT